MMYYNMQVWNGMYIFIYRCVKKAAKIVLDAA